MSEPDPKAEAADVAQAADVAEGDLKAEAVKATDLVDVAEGVQVAEAATVTDLVDDASDNQPAVMKDLRLWWVLAVGIMLALLFALTDHMWRCTGTLVATLVLCAGLRALTPMELAGGLVVRRPWIDVASLLLLAVAVGVVGFNLDLTALR